MCTILNVCLPSKPRKVSLHVCFHYATHPQSTTTNGWWSHGGSSVTNNQNGSFLHHDYLNQNGLLHLPKFRDLNHIASKENDRHL